MSRRGGLLALFLLLGCPAPTTGARDAATQPSEPKTAALVAPDPPADASPAADPAAAAIERATKLAHSTLILDGHVDLPWRLYQGSMPDGTLGEDVARSTRAGDFDYPRAAGGGLDAPFMSIYVPSDYAKLSARELADRLIDIVESIVRASPDKFALARSPVDVRANFAAGKISLPMGMENGAPIGTDLNHLQHFYDRGIRYITLTHGKDNAIADSSYDGRHTHRGLSSFGRKVVTRMNELGIMIDVSHLSDQAFWHVLELSRVPVIASHSSCRSFTPGFERNMSDEMIEALARQGGVIQINFGSTFVDDAVRKQRDARKSALDTILTEKGLTWEDPKAKPVIARYDAEHPPAFATAEQVVDHIEHVIKLVGVDHVGLGSDFDGVGDSMPIGLKDVSAYPTLIRILQERGYDEVAIEKIASGNVLRVWSAVEAYARRE